MDFKIADNKFKELLIPTILIAMALNISAVVDSFFVASFIGQNAVAAIEIVEPVVLLITVFEWLFGLGGQILSLNKKAEFDEEGSNRYFTAAVIVSVLLSVIIVALALINANAIVYILNPPKAVLPYVQQYAPFLFLCFIVSSFSGVITQFIRVDGQPNLASITIIFANVVNLFLDFIFMYHMHMGIAGASLASLIGYSACLILVLKYFLDPKRSFKLIPSRISIKNWIKSTWDIVKIGFPSAGMGIFEVVMVYAVNLFLTATLGELGLTTYVVCMNALVLISIVIIGISEALTSIVPMYYVKYDYLNLNHIIRRAIMMMMVCSILFSLFMWIWPEGFLALYGFKDLDIAPFIVNALRLYTFYFILSSIPTMLIFYYEAIERSLLSTLLSLMMSLLTPVICVVSLYYIMGSDGIWIGFPVSAIITMVFVIIAVKIMQIRENEYSGLFFIKRDLIPRTRNYLLSSSGGDREEFLEHLKGLNTSEKFRNDVEELVDGIFKLNGDDLDLEILVIDYEDNVHLDIKYDGEKENLEALKKEFKDKDFKCTEVLGFNNIEYVFVKS